MHPVSLPHTSKDAPEPKDGHGTTLAKRLLQIEETAQPDPKRAKTSNEGTPDTASDKGSHVPGRPGKPDAKQKPQKGKQTDKNKGRRRGTRPQVEDDPYRRRTPRLPKKQCAILIGFSGTNYAGMQMYASVPPFPRVSQLLTTDQPT